MKTRQMVGKKICAMMVIIAIMASNFFVVGKEAVSYALELAKTNNDSVEFSAYFLDENGEKVSQKEKEMVEKEEMLYVEVAVKNEGYFDGVLSLDSSNLEIDKTFLSDAVEEITESGEIKLKQINAGVTAIVQIKVIAKENQEVTIESLQSETKIDLSGKYINSKNVEKQKAVDIKGETEVELDWTSKAEIDLSEKVFTNKIYKSGEKSNRIVQLEVESRLVENNYPVKTSKIELEGLKGAEQVRVEARSTNGTNSKIEFNQNSYVYNKDTGILNIFLLNEDEEAVNWEKEGKDELIITYTLGEEDVTEEEIKVTSEIETYDGKLARKEISEKVGEEREGTVSYKIEATEEIYKGKLQTGEAKEYETTTEIDVNYITGLEKVNIVEEGKFVAGDVEQDGDIVYKETRINKEEALRILGEEGYITIKDEQGRVVGNVNKDSQTNEEGKVVIKYSEGTRRVQVETSEVKEIGTIKLENIKEARGEVRDIRAIREKVTGEKGEEFKEVVLKDTETKATIQVSTDELTTLDKNENVKITVSLLNNEESKDLYRNPELKIKMPRQVRRIDAKCRLLYGNGLELETAEIREEEGRQVIYLKLNGDQEKYNTEVVEGTTIVIYADIELNERETNSEEKIELEYTNEKYGKAGRDEKDIRIISRAGLIVTNDIGEYGVETLGDEGTKGIVIEEGNRRKEATVGIGIINNEESKISNVRVLGRFPTKEQDTMGVKVTEGIAVEGAEVYYSDKADATDSLENINNNWSRNLNLETAKSYLIVKDNMENGEKLNANYKIDVPDFVRHDLNAEETYTVNYIDEKTTEQKSEEATEINITTGKGPEITMDVKTTVAGQEVKADEQIVSGEIIKYEVTLTNNGSKDATNVQVSETLNNNGTVVNYEKLPETLVEGEEGTGDLNKFTDLEEKTISKVVDNIPIGGTVKVDLYARATSNGVLGNQIQINYNERERKVTTSNQVIPSNIKTTLEAATFDSDQNNLRINNIYIYTLKVENTSSDELKNVKVNFVTNDIVNIIGLQYQENEQYTEIDENELTINLGAKESEEIIVYAETTKSGTAEFYGVVAEGNTTVRSNEITKEIKAFDINMNLSATNAGEEVNPGQEIYYTIDINNSTEGSEVASVEVIDNISQLMEIINVLVDDEIISEEGYDIEYGENSDKITLKLELQPLQRRSVQIRVKVKDNALDIIKQDTEMKNSAEVKINDEVLATSDEISHILRSDGINTNSGSTDPSGENNKKPEIDEDYTGRTPGSVDGEDEENSNNNGNSSGENGNSGENQNPQGENQGETTPRVTHSIFGTVWKDENKDGIKDNKEPKMENILVELLDANNAQKIKETRTDSQGTYTFSGVPESKYIVVFNYDTERYIPTSYQVENVPENKNSDAMTSRVLMSGTEKTAAITDAIDLTANKINIDLGIIDAVTYDISLTKTISKVTITNRAGTETREYDGADLAKAEIHSKNLEGSTVVIEYKISVKNEGDVAGYIKSIVDYKPTDLTFESRLNNGWYQSEGNLYTASLANTKIEPGETKVLTLILTKTMTETNTGLVNNLAEIAEDYNTLSLTDKDSISGNRQKGEDDLGSANVIVSVKTGAAVGYLTIVIAIIAFLGITAYVINIKNMKMPKSDSRI